MSSTHSQSDRHSSVGNSDDGGGDNDDDDSDELIELTPSTSGASGTSGPLRTQSSRPSVARHTRPARKNSFNPLIQMQMHRLTSQPLVVQRPGGGSGGLRAKIRSGIDIGDIGEDSGDTDDGGGGGGYSSVPETAPTHKKQAPPTLTGSPVNGSVSLKASEYDEHGLALHADVTEAYATQRVLRASKIEIGAARVAAVLNDDLARMHDHEFMSLIMLGVPSSHRRAVWLVSSGVDVRMRCQRPLYKSLKRRLDLASDIGAVGSTDTHPVPHKVRDQIDKDIHRTIGGTIRRDRRVLFKRMRRVLLLHAMQMPEENYSQALNFITMSFLVLGFTNEEAFWMLEHVTTRLFPITFDESLTGMRADTEAFEYYFRKSFPDLWRFLGKNGLSIGMICGAPMIGTLLIEKMPYESAWCVWDLMFAAGVVEFFNALLKIMKHVIARLPQRLVALNSPVDDKNNGAAAAAAAAAPSSSSPSATATRSRFVLPWLRKNAAPVPAPPSSPPPVPPLDLSSATVPEPGAATRIEYQMDGCDAVSLIAMHVRQIVDMPLLLATTKLQKKIDAAALEMRRNRYRLHFLNQDAEYRRDAAKREAGGGTTALVAASPQLGSSSTASSSSSSKSSANDTPTETPPTSANNRRKSRKSRTLDDES